MGKLKPGTTYIYERDDKGNTYSREMGSTDRKLIGYGYGQKELDEHNLFVQMRLASKTNKTLRKALDRAIMIYQLSESDSK